MLEAGHSVNIGTEDGTNRVHRLFYSIPDRMCFVAVEDHINAVLITILPIDYHDNIAWRVSDAAQRQATALVVATTTEADCAVNTRSATTDNSAGPTVFRITAYCHDGSSQLRAINLGSWPCGPYGASIERLLDDDAFFVAVQSRLSIKGFQPATCDSVYVRCGNGKPTRISLKVLDSTHS